MLAEALEASKPMARALEEGRRCWDHQVTAHSPRLRPAHRAPTGLGPSCGTV